MKARSIFLIILLLFANPVLAVGCLKEGALNKYKAIADSHGASMGIMLTIIDLKTGKEECSETHNQDLQIYPASSMKVFVVAAALRKIDEGKLHLNESIAITQSNAGQDCGGPCGKWIKGSRHSLLDLVKATIIDSNNITTNQLIDLIGREEITGFARDFDATQTVIRRKVYASVDPEPRIKERNFSTASDLAAFYRELYFNQKDLLSDQSRKLFLDILGSTEHNDRFNLHFKDRFTFHHKTGSTSRSASDGGFLVHNDRLIIMTGLLESTGSVGPYRWDFKILSDLGKEMMETNLP